RLKLRSFLRKNELERPLNAGERTAKVVDDLRGEIGLCLLRFALERDVLEPERDRGRAIVIDVHDLVDPVRASLDVDVDRMLIAGIEKESLQPAALAGDGAR